MGKKPETIGLWHGDVTLTHKIQDDAGGYPGVLRGGRTAFPGWRRRVGLPGILRNHGLSGIPLRLHYVEAYNGQIHSACRGALNVDAKAGCREGVRGVSYSLDI